MEEGDKILYRKKNIILATAGLFVSNAILSMTLTNITADKTGLQTTSWNEIFIYARPLLILLYMTYLLSLFERSINIEKKIVSFIMAHIDVIFLIIIFLYLALYEMYCSYFSNQFTSPDSCGYMREASSLLAGNGFYVDRLAGYDTWFANWPIGYPALIAVMTFITGHSVYFSSKLLSIMLVGAGLFVLRLKFKKDAWIFSLIYLNIGFLGIYRYTWSENPFIFCLILWGIALGTIAEKTKPSKWWYAIMVLGILGAFLIRYFGIVTILFTGFCLLLYILSYFIKNRDTHILAKIKGLLCVETVSSIIVGLYFLLNRTMGGTISGVDRKLWWDDYNELISNLYDGLIREIYNATRINIESLMPDFYPQGKAAVVLLCLVTFTIILIKDHQKEKKFDYKAVFVGAGIFYYFVFIVIRFHSSMDPFDARFLAPAGMMISIGILGLIKDKFGERIKSFQIVLCMFLFVLCGGLVQKIKYYTVETSAYHIFYHQAVDPVALIPSKGLILDYDGLFPLTAFRPDIMLNGQITHDDTMETILSRYIGSDSIWIRRGVLNTIVNDENYSEEIRNIFLQYVAEEADEDEYIQVH